MFQNFNTLIRRNSSFTELFGVCFSILNKQQLRMEDEKYSYVY